MFIKFVRHPAAKFIHAVFGFFASFNLVRSASATFNFNARLVFGELIFTRDVVGLISVIVLVLCIFLLILGVWHTRPEKFSVLHKLDVSLIFTVTACVVIFCVRLVFLRIFSVLVILAVPPAVYFVIIFLLVQFVARLRDKTLSATQYWWNFYNLPHVFPKIAMGTLMLLFSVLLALEGIAVLGLITGNSSLLSASVIWRVGRGINLVSYLTYCVIVAVSFCALNYFAAFVLGLSSQYEAANAEKIRSERFKAELITNVSHDIRTPLTSIINYTNILKSQQLQGETASYVDVLDKKSTRLKQLLSDLIDASQASAGAVKIDIQPLNLSEMLGQVAGEFSDIFDENDLTLVLRQPQGLPLYVLADSRHLFRAMENLFSNAAKYSLPGTRVFAEIEGAGTNVVFTLRNTSKDYIDVPPEVLTEQFIRGDLARQSEGSGLGLHIAKSLIELMYGQLKISLRGDLFEVVVLLKA